MTEFGIGTYTRNVVRALGRLDRQNKYFLIGSPEKVREIGPLPANFHTAALRSGPHPAPVLPPPLSALPLRHDRARPAGTHGAVQGRRQLEACCALSIDAEGPE